MLDKNPLLGPGKESPSCHRHGGVGVRDEGKKVSREHAEQAQGKRENNVILFLSISF